MSVSIKLYQTQSPQYISKIYFIQNMCVLNMKQNDRWSGLPVCSTGKCTQPFLPAISITEVIQNKIKYSVQSTTLVFAGVTEGHFEGKMPQEGHQWGLVLARQCAGSPGTCNPEETGLRGFPMSWSSTLFSESGPVGLPPVPWTEKKNWKVAIFQPTRRSFLQRRPGWMDNFLGSPHLLLVKVTATG